MNWFCSLIVLFFFQNNNSNQMTLKIMHDHHLFIFKTTTTKYTVCIVCFSNIQCLGPVLTLQNFYFKKIFNLFSNYKIPPTRRTCWSFYSTKSFTFFFFYPLKRHYLSEIFKSFLMQRKMLFPSLNKKYWQCLPIQSFESSYFGSSEVFFFFLISLK